MNGFSLTELVVTASLMGILFVSGLQFLGTLGQVEATLPRPALEDSVWPLRLALQEAKNVEVSEGGKRLQAVVQGKKQIFRFKGGKLLAGEELLSPQAGRFDWQPPLLRIELENAPPIEIWMRNHAGL